MLSQHYFDFFAGLERNNTKEWFDAHKADYERHVKGPFRDLVAALIEAVREREPDLHIEPKDTLFRINRDIRFSKDKSPYKTHMGAIISKYGRKSEGYPGFYIHAEATGGYVGGGAYGPDKERLSIIREMIADDPAAFRKLIGAKPFVKHFESIKGERNKIVPAEFKEAAAAEPLIANKQFYYMAPVPPEIFMRKDAVKAIMAYYDAARPLREYLAQAFE